MSKSKISTRGQSRLGTHLELIIWLFGHFNNNWGYEDLHGTQSTLLQCDYSILFTVVLKVMF